MEILKCEFCKEKTRIAIKSIGEKIYIESYCSTCNFHSFGEITNYNELKVASIGKEEDATKTYYFQLTGVIKSVDSMEMLRDTGALERDDKIVSIPYNKSLDVDDIITINKKIYKVVKREHNTWVLQKLTVEEIEK